MSGARTQPIDLLDSDGDLAVVQAGESCTIVAEMKHGTAAIAKADLGTLTLTLFDEATAAVINAKNATNVKDAGGGSVSDAGVITMKLEAADNPIVGSGLGVGDQEAHIARFSWTWSDGGTRTGIQEVRFRVEKLATPTGA